MEYNFLKHGVYRWKGKIRSKKFYERKMREESRRAARKQDQNDQKPEDQNNEESLNSKDCQGRAEDVNQSDFAVKGERIIDLEFLARHLRCTACEEHLLLENIKQETRRGCKSILDIECHSCLLINKIPTGRQSSNDNQNKHFDFNYKITKGLIHAGIGFHSFDKLCASVDIPFMSRKTFKFYEKRVSGVAEDMATASSEAATHLEKE